MLDMVTSLSRFIVLNKIVRVLPATTFINSLIAQLSVECFKYFRNFAVYI